MSEDPLHMSGLEAEVIQEQVDKRKKAKNPTAEARELNAQTAAQREARLAKGPPPPPPPTPIEPEVVDKTALLDKLTQYKERFPKLKSRNKISAKSAVEEIEDEIHYIEQQLGQKEGTMGVQLLVLTMSGVEEVTKHYNPLGLNLTGLAKVTQDNQDQFAPILDELMIKYGASMYVGPEMRLAMALGSLVYTVHSANSGDVRVAKAMAQMNKVVVDQGKSDL